MVPGPCCFVMFCCCVLFFFAFFCFAFLFALFFRFLFYPLLQLRCRHGIAHGQEGGDVLLRGGAVQEEGDPLILVHVVGRKETGFAPEGADDHRVAFDVQDIHGALLPEAEGPVRNGHHNAEPLAVVNVAENAGGIVPWKGIVRFHTVFIENVVCQFLPGH